MWRFWMIDKLFPRGVRLLRRFPIGRFVRVNLSKHGLGLSVGRRGLWVTLNPQGKIQFWLGVPGTGLGYRRQVDLRWLLSALAAAAQGLRSGSPPHPSSESNPVSDAPVGRRSSRRPGRIRRDMSPSWRRTVEEARRILREYRQQQPGRSQNPSPNGDTTPTDTHRDTPSSGDGL